MAEIEALYLQYLLMSDTAEPGGGHEEMQRHKGRRHTLREACRAVAGVLLFPR
jgi:hypothetical protein